MSFGTLPCPFPKQDLSESLFEKMFPSATQIGICVIDLNTTYTFSGAKSLAKLVAF